MFICKSAQCDAVVEDVMRLKRWYHVDGDEGECLYFCSKDCIVDWINEVDCEICGEVHEPMCSMPDADEAEELAYEREQDRVYQEMKDGDR